MSKDEAIRACQNKYRRELESLQTNLSFWESQPDLGIRGFDVTQICHKLRLSIDDYRAGLKVLEASDL